MKRNRNTALIEFRDKEVCDKVLQLPDGEKPVRCGIEPLTAKVNRKIFKENDEKISLAMQEIIDKNPAVLENVQSNRFSGPPPLKRGRFNGPDQNFGNLGNRNDFNSMNSNNDFSNPQVIQDLLRLAFISGKNLGEGLASGNNNPFNNSSDSPLSSLNLANGFSGRNFGGLNNGFGNNSGNRNNFGNNQNNFNNRNNSGGNQNNRNNGNNFGGQKQFGNNSQNNQNQNRNNNQNQNQNRQGGGNQNRRF